MWSRNNFDCQNQYPTKFKMAAFAVIEIHILVHKSVANACICNEFDTQAESRVLAPDLPSLKVHIRQKCWLNCWWRSRFIISAPTVIARENNISNVCFADNIINAAKSAKYIHTYTHTPAHTVKHMTEDCASGHQQITYYLTEKADLSAVIGLCNSDDDITAIIGHLPSISSYTTIGRWTRTNVNPSFHSYTWTLHRV